MTPFLSASKISQKKFCLIVPFFVPLLFLGVCGCSSAAGLKNYRNIDQLPDGKRNLQPQAFKKGGTIFLTPFSAGVDVEASVQVDKMSLMIVKGFAEVLQQSATSLSLVTAEDAPAADFVIKGRIVSVGRSGGIKQWLPGQGGIFLKIKCQMVAQKNEDLVFWFSEGKKGSSDDEFADLAYALGQELARFVLEGANAAAP